VASMLTARPLIRAPAVIEVSFRLRGPVTVLASAEPRVQGGESEKEEVANGSIARGSYTASFGSSARALATRAASATARKVTVGTRTSVVQASCSIRA
jgi:hypothetical protein